ncbi:MAG: outer membrane lipoprotein chaperone LolA [Burkholderiaceae bacterium]|nr:outer membrane lipoprotein chaperone LolA [Burkholderiaceae bacterium]
MRVRSRLRAAVLALTVGRGLVVAIAFVLALALGLATQAQAAAGDALRDFLSSTHSASGTFTQQVLRDGRVVESSSGRFAFQRPGRFRWEVTQPFEQLLVGDGERLYFYDKDLNQVTVRKLRDALASTPAAILFGSSDVEAGFTLRALPARDGLERVEALPRNAETGYQRIEFGFRGGLPVVMQVQDAFGRNVRFEFHDVVRDPKLAADTFRFVPPPGADVVEQ